MGTVFLRPRGRPGALVGFSLFALLATGIAWTGSKSRTSWAVRGKQAYRRGEWSEAAEIARGWLRSLPKTRRVSGFWPDRRRGWAAMGRPMPCSPGWASRP